MEEQRVFVYGTLMRGQRHAAQIEGCRFLGVRHSLPEYRLVLIDYYPAMIAGGEVAVTGELYTLDGDTLKGLDALEEHPDFYQRAQIQLQEGEQAWCYLLPDVMAGQGVPLAGGDFRACSSAWLD